MSRIRPWTNGDQVALDAFGSVPTVLVDQFGNPYSTTGTSLDVNVTNTVPVSGPLTDTELRASQVPVVGPVTNAELRATAVPVSGPLTDAQLRATSVDVDSQLIDEVGTPYGVKHVENKPRVSSTPYLFDIAEGNVTGHFSVYKFGMNPAVGTSEETVWGEGGLYPWAAIDAAAGTVTISSTSANDTSPAGTGVRTATIYGLDLAGVDQSESLTMAGQTPVTSVNSYSRVFRIICNTAGTTLANEGVIRVGTGAVAGGVPAVVWAHVDVGDNQTLQCVFTVPAGKTLYITRSSYSVQGTKGAECRIRFRPSGQLFQIKDVIHLDGGNTELVYDAPLALQAGTDVDFRATAGVAGTDVGATFTGWYE